MRRLLLAVVLTGVVVLTSAAADPVPDKAVKAAALFVRDDYDSRVRAASQAVAAAEKNLKTKGYTAENIKRLKDAKENHKKVAADTDSVIRRDVYLVTDSERVIPQTVAEFVPGEWSARPSGLLVAIPTQRDLGITPDGQTVDFDPKRPRFRQLIVKGAAAPKFGEKPPPLAGFYYVTGTEKAGGQDVPVVVPLTLGADDLPAAAKK